jgi:uncharacterized protein YjbJ (UPF0337 family)
MKRSSKNQIEGRGRELKGSLKEKAGRAMNRPGMENRGTAQKYVGKLQK